MQLDASCARVLDSPAMKRGITFGTFDVFHYGHLRILERTR